MGIEAAGLQSGFVIGIVIAAFLLADRLGGTEILALRVAQLALGIVLTMLVVSATATVWGPPDPHFGTSDGEFAWRSSVIGTIHIGLAIIFVAGGIALSRTWRSIAPGVLLAGVLLMLVGVPTGWPGGGYGEPLYRLVAALLPGLRAIGDVYSIARVVVLIVGAVLLAGTIYFRWERDAGNEAVEAADPEASSS